MIHCTNANMKIWTFKFPADDEYEVKIKNRGFNVADRNPRKTIVHTKRNRRVRTLSNPKKIVRRGKCMLQRAKCLFSPSSLYFRESRYTGRNIKLRSASLEMRYPWLSRFVTGAFCVTERVVLVGVVVVFAAANEKNRRSGSFAEDGRIARNPIWHC